MSGFFWIDLLRIGGQIVYVRDLWLIRISVKARDCYWVTGDLSCGSELLNGFLDRSRWLEPLYKNILQRGQDFCRSASNELL